MTSVRLALFENYFDTDMDAGRVQSMVSDSELVFYPGDDDPTGV
jgi:hypothetical protein